ncbi:MAG: polyketide synthase dehydratase domain-containing protein, partial [Candidatus Anammoxibacter sp.]
FSLPAATLSHETDLYLPEHVFDGTPMFPGVMGIEAMVQAAMACTGRNELPVVRNIQFNRPLIVPESTKIVIRTLALADQPENGTIRVKVAIRSESDQFQQNFFEAECFFGLEKPKIEDLPKLPTVPEPIDKDPEDFAPVPLFQGKFFRRIKSIRKMEIENESLTEINIPNDAQYYGDGFEQNTVTLFPVARDSFFQSCAIILTKECLPVRIDEIRFHKKTTSSSSLLSQCIVREKTDKEYKIDITAFNLDGNVVETLKGFTLRILEK